MPVARVKLPDGRIARLKVPEGTTQDQVVQFVANQIREGGLSRPDSQPAPRGETPGISTIRQAISQQRRAQMEHTPQITPRQQVLSQEYVRRALPLSDVMSRLKPDIRPGMSAAPEKTMAQRVMEKLGYHPGKVTPESQAKAVIGFQAMRQGTTPKQLVEDVGARTGILERGLKDIGAGAIGTAGGLLGYVARFAGDDGLVGSLKESAQIQASELLPSDPNFWDQLLSAVGSTASFYLPGYGIVKGAQAVYNVAPRLALWLGAGSSAGLEAATEAGSVYDDLIRQGKTPEEAAEAADKAFFANQILVAYTNRLGLFGDKGTQILRRTYGAATEGSQEMGQQVISNVLTGRPASEGVAESGLIGALIGAGFAGNIKTPVEELASEYQRNIKEKDFDAEQAALRSLQPEERRDGLQDRAQRKEFEEELPQREERAQAEEEEVDAGQVGETEAVHEDVPQEESQEAVSPEESRQEVRQVKPRIAESPGELYEEIQRLTDSGVPTKRGILYPVVQIPGDGTRFRISSKGVEVIEQGGSTVRPAEDSEVSAVEDAIRTDTAQVVLMTRWGGSGRDTASKPYAVLHSPSGRSFAPRGTTPEETLDKAKMSVSSGPGENYKGMIQHDDIVPPKGKGKVYKNPKRRQDIIREFIKDIDQRVFYGRVKGKKTLGYYRPKKATVRLKKANDLEVLSHEIAHYVDDIAWKGFSGGRRPWTSGKGARRYANELKGLSYDQGKVYEGFAEFVRHWMTNPEYAREKAPEFYKYWENFVSTDKRFGPALKKAQAKTLSWYQQGSLERAFSKIGGDPARSVNKSLDSIWGRARQSIFDDLHGVLLYELRGTGKKSPVSLGPYETARLARAAYSIVDGAFRFGAPVKRGTRWTYVDMNGEPVTLIRHGNVINNPKYKPWGLANILAQVENELNEWIGYAVGLSARELKEQGRENLFEKDEIDALIALGDGKPHFRKAFDEYQIWNRQVLDFAESTGILSGDARKNFRRNMYLPFYRVGTDESVKRKGGVEGNLKVIHRLTGGTENLNDVLENIINNATTLIVEGIKNDARLAIVDFADKHPGLGRFIEKIPPDTKRVSVTKEQVIDEVLKSLGVERPAAYRSKWMKGEEQDPVIDKILERYEDVDDFMQFYIFGQSPRGDNIIAVLREGKVEYYEISDTLLYRSIASFNRKGPKTVIGKFMNAVRRVGQTTVTLTLDFMTANLWRDTLHAWAFSRHGFMPVIDTVKGIKSRALSDPAYAEFIANGGGLSSYLLDQKEMESHLRYLYTRKKVDIRWVMHLPHKAFMGMTILADAAEMATRIGEFKKAIARGESPREAAYSAREVSVDFAMRGDSEIVNMAYNQILFLKAAMNGMDRFYRGFVKDDNKKAIWVKSGLIALASVALYLINRNNKCYQDIEDWERDTHWHVFIPKVDNPADCSKDYFVMKFPKIWEIGAISSAAERTMEFYLKGVEENHGKEYADRMANIFLDLFKVEYLPQWAAPLVEVYWLNKNRFTERPIVPMSLKDAKPFAQATPYTSTTLVNIAEKTAKFPEELQFSPARAEALIRGYFNTWGMYGLMMTDFALYGDELPDLRPDQMMVLRRFTKSYPLTRTKYGKEFWDFASEVQSVHRTFKAMEGNLNEELAMFYGSKPEARLIEFVNSVKKQIKLINGQMIEIKRREDLSPEEKRELLNKLQDEKNIVYEQAMQTIDMMEREGG